MDVLLQFVKDYKNHLVMFVCRAFKIVKDLIHERGYVNDAANRHVNMKDSAKLKAVSTFLSKFICRDAYTLMGKYVAIQGS